MVDAAGRARLDKKLQKMLDDDDGIDAHSVGRTCRLVAEFLDDAKMGGGAGRGGASDAVADICGRIGREYG